MIEAYEITLKCARLISIEGVFEKGFKVTLSPDHHKFGFFRGNESFNLKKVQVPDGEAARVGSALDAEPPKNESPAGDPDPESIDGLEISAQAKKALEEAGVDTVAKLKEIGTLEKLIEIKGIGEPTAEKILAILGDDENEDEE